MSRRAGEPAAVTSFGQHAEESLQFIRRTMERSSTFTAVPGAGRRRHGRHRPGRRRSRGQPELRRTMAHRLAAGGGRRPGHRRHRHVAQGRPSRRAAGRRRRTPLRDEPGRAARRRGGADLGRLDARRLGLDACRVAPALRHRRAGRRRLQCRGRATARRGVHGAGRRGAGHAPGVGQCLARDGFRWAAASHSGLYIARRHGG